jgi:peptide/nickel transport system permease protein
VLIWLLLVGAVALGVLSARKPLLRAAWRRVGRSRAGMASATVLVAFVVVGLLDSLHYRPRLEHSAGQGAARQRAAGDRSTRSKCCRCSTSILSSLRTRNEKDLFGTAGDACARQGVDRVRDADGQLRQTATIRA